MCGGFHPIAGNPFDLTVEGSHIEWSDENHSYVGELTGDEAARHAAGTFSANVEVRGNSADGFSNAGTIGYCRFTGSWEVDKVG